MRKSIKIGIAVVLLLIAGVVSLLLYVRNHGFSAREKPSRIEEIMARHARRIATPAGARAQFNAVAIAFSKDRRSTGAFQS